MRAGAQRQTAQALGRDAGAGGVAAPPAAAIQRHQQAGRGQTGLGHGGGDLVQLRQQRAVEGVGVLARRDLVGADLQTDGGDARGLVQRGGEGGKPLKCGAEGAQVRARGGGAGKQRQGAEIGMAAAQQGGGQISVQPAMAQVVEHRRGLVRVGERRGAEDVEREIRHPAGRIEAPPARDGEDALHGPRRLRQHACARGVAQIASRALGARQTGGEGQPVALPGHVPSVDIAQNGRIQRHRRGQGRGWRRLGRPQSGQSARQIGDHPVGQAQHQPGVIRGQDRAVLGGKKYRAVGHGGVLVVPSNCAFRSNRTGLKYKLNGLLTKTCWKHWQHRRRSARTGASQRPRPQ